MHPAGSPSGLHGLVVGADFFDGKVSGVLGLAGHNFSESVIGHAARRRNSDNVTAPTPSTKVELQHADDVHMLIVPNPERTSTQNPERAPHYYAAMPDRNIAAVLADNVERLIEHAIEHGRPCNGLRPLARRAGISAGTVTRILDRQESTGIEIVDSVAGAFGLVAYQLLIPNLDPADPQWLPVTGEEKQALKIAQLSLREIGNAGAGVANELERTDSAPGGGASHHGVAKHRQGHSAKTPARKRGARKKKAQA